MLLLHAQVMTSAAGGCVSSRMGVGDDLNGVTTAVVRALLCRAFFVLISAISAPNGLILADLECARAEGWKGDMAAMERA
jgi:hypothetical protein